MFKPKFFSILKHRDKELNQRQLVNDIIAGIIVAIIALPLSVALGIASGVSPEKGLITAIIAGFLISFLGGSRVQIGGPTGAFVVIVYGIIEKYGIEGLTIATIMAGIILTIMGFLKVGSLIKYIPYTITTGFTTGIALVLLSTQVKDFLGLKIDKVPSEFIPKWIAYINNISSIQWHTVLIGIVSLAIIIYWPKINKTIPGSLIALVIATVLVKFLNLPVETIGDRFGEISSTIHISKIKILDITTLTELIKPAITIALLAGVESLLSAVVADNMISKKHNSNTELIAQGIANIASALFGGIPATGAIARTAANIKNGGRTPVSGIIHAITLFLIMMIFMPLAKLIPMTTLGAILIVVSYNMSHMKEFRSLLRAPKGDVAVLLATFVLTVVFDLVVAIEIGMIIAMIVLMIKTAENTSITNIVSQSEFAGKDEEIAVDNFDKERFAIYEVKGPLFFGAVQSFKDSIDEITSDIDVLVLSMDRVPMMDATACDALKKINDRCVKNNIELIFSGVNEKPMRVINKIGLCNIIGSDRFLDNMNDAMFKAKQILDNREKQSA